MRYVIVSVVKGKAGNFNNNLRKEVFQKFNAKSSKLPAHFTIKAPFEYDDIEELEEVLQNFCKTHKRAPYKLKNYNHFENSSINMEVIMSKDGKKLHDDLFDELNKISYINFGEKDGKDKIFHVTISSKKIQTIFDELWDYVNSIPCDFDCEFDNVSIFKWKNNTWILHKEYKFN